MKKINSLTRNLSPSQVNNAAKFGCGRYELNNANIKSVLVHNAPYIFTCRQSDGKLVCLENHSVVIEKDTIKEIVPAKKTKSKNFDLVYDAGQKGGIAITPGLVNAHAHIHMYLMRSAMIFDESENEKDSIIDQAIVNMAAWQKFETDNSFTLASIGDLTEQQKMGITTTLTHGPSFQAAEIACQATQQNVVNAVSAVSNSRPSNTPEKLEKIAEKNQNSSSRLAVALHYLHRTSQGDLKKVKAICEKNNLLLTCHLAESQGVARQCEKKHKKREVELLEKYGLLNSNTLISHVIHVDDDEIKKLAQNKVGIVHLPTSNAIHKAGVFPFWKFYENEGINSVALGTDSVVSKSRLDILTEAYQTRLTHLYSRKVKYGTLFKMMTSNGARVLQMPERGTIQPGQKADLVFWKLKDRGFIPYNKSNPFSLLGNIITHNGRMVRDLMINGEFVITNRKHLLVDESKLLDKLQDKHMEMRKKASGEN